MKKEKIEVNVLDELNKGACMGIDAINFIIDKVTDQELKEELTRQSREYNEIIKKISKLYPDYSKKEVHKTNTMNKVMTWYGIEIKTITDDTTSHLAEILMQGTNMGIIEGRKLLNHKECDKEVKKILEQFISIQQKSVEKLKEFL
ncbi:MAG: hypothetical protein ACI4XM_03020 [Candidatus Coprovivens sp.]